MADSNVEQEVAATAGSSPAKQVESASNDGDKNGGTPKSSPSKAEMEGVKVAMQLLANGKRNLLIQDPNAAVESLAMACEQLGKLYGETAKECGEAYFYYGKALLDLARLEAGVIENLGDDSEENSADDDDDEEESEEKKEEPAPGPSGEGSSKTAESAEAGPSSSKDDSKEGDEAEADDGKENESIGSNDAGPSNAKEDIDKAAIEAEDEEDPSNLQLAWEMLELAKEIFLKHAGSLEAMDPVRLQLERKLDETYLTLGEVSIENENYEQAIEDLTTCLKRRQELLPRDSRCIAETFYQLGVAQGFNLQFDEAIESLGEAIGTLETRIVNLKNKTESKDPAKKEDAFYTREREIAEIESLIPEIKEKIADTNDMKAETFKKLGDRRLVEEMMGGLVGALNGGEADSSKNTSNISHLVKKRKKADGEEEEEAGTSEAKKAHVDNGGAAASSSTSNGHGN